MQVESVRKRWLNEVEACVYTGLSFDQIDHAVRNGLFEWDYAANGAKRADLEKLDKFMTSGQKPRPRPKAS